MRRHIQLPKGRLDALRLSAMQRHYRQTWGPGRTPKLVLFKFQTDGRSSVRRSGSLSAQCPSRSSERKKSSSTTELTDAICDELMMLLAPCAALLHVPTTRYMEQVEWRLMASFLPSHPSLAFDGCSYTAAQNILDARKLSKRLGVAYTIVGRAA